MMNNYLQLLSQFHQASDYATLNLISVCENYKTIHLLYLINSQPSNQKALAKKVGMTEPALSMKLKIMEKDELIEKVRNNKDRRHYQLQLTKKGHHQITEWESLLQQHAQAFFSPLTLEECHQLNQILNKLGQQF